MTWPKIAFAVLITLVPVLRAQTPAEPKVVTITAKRFEYSPKEVHLKKGESVTLLLKSEDVTHGFLSRKLGIDTDIPPGQETPILLTPTETGRFTVICNHFCGSGHGNMKMTLIVD